MHFLKIISKAITVSASLAFAGCIAHESDDFLGESVGEAEQAIRIGQATITCDSKWPGVQDCSAFFGDGSEIIPGTLSMTIIGHNGAKSKEAYLIENNRKIRFFAVIHEGDLFSPGKNTTTFALAWAYVQ
jgi:hypothetical protein